MQNKTYLTMSQLNPTQVLRELVSALAVWIDRRRRARAQFANVGEGNYGHGRRSFLPDSNAVTTSRYLLYKLGSDADHVTTTVPGDAPIGQSDDVADPNNLDVPICVNLFGAVPGTLRVVSDGTITNGCWVVAGANGQAAALPSATGTYYVVGRALFGTDTTTNAGDVVTIISSLPMKVVQ